MLPTQDHIHLRHIIKIYNTSKKLSAVGWDTFILRSIFIHVQECGYNEIQALLVNIYVAVSSILKQSQESVRIGRGYDQHCQHSQNTR